jgi:hypothetical protein
MTVVGMTVVSMTVVKAQALKNPQGGPIAGELQILPLRQAQGRDDNF